MKNVYTRFSLYAMSAALLLTPAFSGATNLNLSCQVTFIPYIGASVQGLHQSMPSNLGGRIFKKGFPQFNTFAGVRFNDYMAIEGGYELTPTGLRVVNLPAGTPMIGGVNVSTSATLAPTIHSSRSQVKDWHASLIGLVPITDIFKLMAGIGASGVDVFYTTHKTNDPTNSNFNVFSTFATFKSKKTVLKLAFGGQLMASNTVGIRATAAWLNTARFGTLSARENATKTIQIKNAWNYGLGVFFEF